MNNDTFIPRRLDDAWKIGLWDVDVAVPVLFFFFIGYMSGSKVAFVISMVTGLGISRWLSRIKSDKHPAFALHWAYWYLPASPATATRATPPSHVVRMIG